MEKVFGWNDLTFYPFFYAIPLLATVDLPAPQTFFFMLAIAGLISLSGWCLARGANMQKYIFRKNPQKAFLGSNHGQLLMAIRTYL